MEKSVSSLRADRKDNSKNGWNELSSDSSAENQETLDERALNEQYPEIEDIRKDWQALKKDVSQLTQHAGADGKKRFNALTHDAAERLERQVNAKPVQTLAIAFAVGVFASMLLRGR